MADQLNIFEAKKLKEEGMQRAVDNAELHAPNWKEQALEYVRNFPQQRFQTEDVRVWAYEKGLERPPHDRAWGAVIAAARKQGIVKHDGYESVSNPAAHSTPASVWVKV